MERWREILSRIIEDSKEKRRIANEIGLLSPRTLDRWADDTSTPKNAQLIRGLARAVSSGEMDTALLEAFPDTFVPDYAPHQSQSAEVGIPTEFRGRVLQAFTTLPANIKYYAVTNLVMEQMVSHLDPDALGVAVTFAKSIILNDTLRHFLLPKSTGSGLWDTRQIVSSRGELEAESFVYLYTAAVTGRSHFLQSIGDNQGASERSLFYQEKEIRSLVIYPVRREAAVAGVLLICARLEDFFISARRKLIEGYAELYGLAYSDSDFYAQIAHEPSLFVF